LRVRELVALRAILDVQDGNHGELYPRKTDFGGSGVPFISAENVWDRVEIESAPKLNHDVAARLRIGFAEPRDIILTHNATVGRVAILPAGSPSVVLSTSTTYYRVDERALVPEYLLLYMRSPFFQQQLAAVMSQTTRNQVPVTKQVELVIAVPSPSEQRAIVERTEQMLSLSSALSTRIDTVSNRVDRISQAALSKAFRGELLLSPTEAA
jgi:type I restriction enzyme S subunit